MRKRERKRELRVVNNKQNWILANFIINLLREFGKVKSSTNLFIHVQFCRYPYFEVFKKLWMEEGIILSEYNIKLFKENKPLVMGWGDGQNRGRGLRSTNF